MSEQQLPEQLDEMLNGDESYDIKYHIEHLQFLCHGLSNNAGWWDNSDPQDPLTVGTKYALIHSEVSEAMEGARKDLMDDHLPNRKMEEVELADVIIRVMDYAGARGLDVSGAIFDKLRYNQQRADHKRENRAKDGGKKF